MLCGVAHRIRLPRRAKLTFAALYVLVLVMAIRHEVSTWSTLPRLTVRHEDRGTCAEVHVAAFLVNASSTVQLLYSVMQARDGPIALHVLACNRLELRVVRTFVNSWRLAGFVAFFHDLSYDDGVYAGNDTELCQRRCFRRLSESSLDAVLLFRDDTWLLRPPGHFWDYVKTARQENVDFVLLASAVEYTKTWQVALVVLQRLRRTRRPWTLTEAMSSSVVRLFQCDDVLVWPIVPGVCYRSTVSHAGAAESVRRIMSRDHDLLRDDGGWKLCRTPTTRTVTPTESPATPNRSSVSKECWSRVSGTVLPRRVHLFWRRANASGSPWNTTIVIQTTLQRLVHVEVTVKRWRGAIHIVVLLRQRQLPELAKIVDTRWRGTNPAVSVHVVFQRNDIYPTNVLRNVGLRQVSTAYVMTLDADLVPSDGLERAVEDELRRRRGGRHVDAAAACDPVALVVPAFKTGRVLTSVPSTRRHLLAEIAAGRVYGYRNEVGWHYGHVATDFRKWARHNGSSYEVRFEGSFEPYVATLTSAAPRFEEAVPNRCSEKFLNVLQLHLRGFRFRVLTSGFLLHLPHRRVVTPETQWFYRCHSAVKGWAIGRARKLAARWKSGRTKVSC